MSNLQVAFEDRKIDTAFWGHKLATAMGQSKTGAVYRLDWMTPVSAGHHLFKLVSNNGTQVEQLHGPDTQIVRSVVKNALLSRSPPFGLSRSEKMNLKASRVSSSFVSHMRVADISQDNSNAYKRRSYRPMLFSQGTALTRRQRRRFAVLLRLSSVQEHH